MKVVAVDGGKETTVTGGGVGDHQRKAARDVPQDERDAIKERMKEHACQKVEEGVFSEK